MGKNDFMTPKAIANRIKAKGLQKLRWYCQLCNKQCRDENGFKCHQMSDSHRRQMELFGQNPHRVVDEFTEEFEKTFLEHLKRAHPFSRVAAKVVYNEFINDRNHVHMNSTRWLTLTDFVKHLGKEGKCKVEETPKGWFITLIQKDPMAELEDDKRLKRTVHEREEEDRQMSAIREQVERARKASGVQEDDEPAQPTELVKDTDAPVVLSLAAPGAAAAAAGPSSAAAPHAMLPPRPRPAVVQAAAFGDDDEDEAPGPSHAGPSSSRPVSKVEQLMRAELEAKAKKARVDYWLHPGIVVKVMSKELKEHGYYKQKGVVEKVVDKYIGEVAMLDSGDVIRVDQAQLETVIPAPGGTVLVVNGLHRGSKAQLMQIDTSKYQAQVKLLDGSYKGKEVWHEYEHICKVASS